MEIRGGTVNEREFKILGLANEMLCDKEHVTIDELIATLELAKLSFEEPKKYHLRPWS